MKRSLFTPIGKILIMLVLSFGVSLLFIACETTPEEHVHNYTESIKKTVSCNQDGIKVFTCADCGDSYEEVIKGGHNWIDATCSTPKTCETCSSVEGEMLGHNYVDNVCSRCEHSIKWTYEDITNINNYASNAYKKAGDASSYAIAALTGNSLYETLYYQQAVIELFNVMDYLLKMKQIAYSKADVILNNSDNTTLREKIDQLYDLCTQTTNIEITSKNYSTIFSNITDINTECLNLQLACMELH